MAQKQKYTVDYIDDIVNEIFKDSMVKDKETVRLKFVNYCIHNNIAICEFNEAHYKG